MLGNPSVQTGAGLTVSPANLKSRIGEHSQLVITATGRADALVVRTAVQMSTRNIELDFYDIQRGYLNARYTAACRHSQDSPFHKDLLSKITPISLEQSLDAKATINVASKHNNSEAQFLCLSGRFKRFKAEPEEREVWINSPIQVNCCINCAYRRAKKRELSITSSTKLGI